MKARRADPDGEAANLEIALYIEVQRAVQNEVQSHGYTNHSDWNDSSGLFSYSHSVCGDWTGTLRMVRLMSRAWFALVLVLWFGSTFACWVYIAVHVNKTPELVAQDTPSKSLPDRCRRYYNDGTTAWIDCMGVGLK